MSEDNELSTQERAERGYRQAVAAQRILGEAVGDSDRDAECKSIMSLGQNILREEIGYFGPWEGAIYSFDQETRDRLLAHCRQDTASAYMMAQSAFKEAHDARRASVSAITFLIVSLLLNAAILATLWLR